MDLQSTIHSASRWTRSILASESENIAGLRSFGNGNAANNEYCIIRWQGLYSVRGRKNVPGSKPSNDGCVGTNILTKKRPPYHDSSSSSSFIYIPQGRCGLARSLVCGKGRDGWRAPYFLDRCRWGIDGCFECPTKVMSRIAMGPTKK